MQKNDEYRKTKNGITIRKRFDSGNHPKPFSILIYDQEADWCGLGSGGSFENAFDNLVEKYVDEIKELKNAIKAKDTLLSNIYEKIGENLRLNQDENEQKY